MRNLFAINNNLKRENISGTFCGAVGPDNDRKAGRRHAMDQAAVKRVISRRLQLCRDSEIPLHLFWQLFWPTTLQIAKRAQKRLTRFAKKIETIRERCFLLIANYTPYRNADT
jgi:hypothetical protein